MSWIRSFGLALVALALAAPAAEPPRAVAALAGEVQPLLDAEHARAALARIAAWRGDEHALIERLRGDAAFLAGEHALAITAYRRALALPDTPAGTRRNLAGALAAAGEHRAAVVEYAAEFAGGSAPAASADDLAAWIRALLASGDARAAALAAAQARLRHPEDQQLARLELLALETTADWGALAAAAAAMLARDGGDAAAWHALIAARVGDGRAGLGDGERDELAATALAARRAGAIDAARLGGYLRFAGLARAAAAAYREALAAPDLTLDQRIAAAEALIEDGDATGARAALDGLPRAMAATPRCRRLAARAALDAGDAPAARRELDALIAEGEADGAVCLWAARLAEDAGDLAAAVERYQRAALDPDHARAGRLGLALTLARLGRRDEALSAARSVLDADPADRYARGVLAWIEARGVR